MRRLSYLFVAGSIAALGSTAMARPVFSAAGPVPIPDAGAGNCLTSPPGAPANLDIVINQNLTISSMKVGVHVQHTWQADVKLELTKVGSGVSVVMLDRPGNPATACGFSADNYGVSSTDLFIFDDGAAMTYDVPNVPAPGIPNVSGSWKPESPLSAFNGMSTQGTWRLSAVDNAEQDIGMLLFFQLDVQAGAACYPDCNGDNILNLADFGCFQTKFALNDPYADCNGDNILNLADFGCFQTKFALGCP